MAKVTIRWLDLDNSLQGQQTMRERILEGENVGYDDSESPLFVRVWADDQTFLVNQSRVILVGVEK